MITRQIDRTTDTTDGRNIRESEYASARAYSTVTPAHPAAVSRVSWGALIAGLVSAVVIQMLLSTLGIAIGLTAVDATTAGAETAESFSMGAGIWWLITGLFSLFVGGWVAGRVAGLPHRDDGMLHGFITWALSAVVGLALLGTTVGTIIGGATRALTDEINVASSQGQNEGVVGAMERGIEQITGQDAELGGVNDADTMDASTPGSAGTTNDTSATRPGDDRLTEAEMREGADQAATTLSIAAWWTFAAMLLGAFMATLGGYLGTPRLVTAVPVAS